MAVAEAVSLKSASFSPLIPEQLKSFLFEDPAPINLVPCRATAANVRPRAMLVLREDEVVIEVGRHRRPRATWLTGIGFVAMASIPLMGSGPMTLLRWATSLTLLAMAFGLFAFAWQRRVQVRLGRDGASLLINGQRVAAKQVELVMGAGQLTDGTASSDYTVHLRAADQPDLLLLEGRHPDRVLMDLRQLATHLKLPVRSGWGLPEAAAPWKAADPTRALPQKVLELHPFQRQRRVAFTVAAGTIGMAVAIWLMVSARLDLGRTIVWGSYALAGLTLVAAGLVAFGAWTDRCIVSISASGIEVEHRMFGMRVGTKHTPAKSWIGAYRVQSTEGELVHVLLDLGDKLVAVACAGDEAAPVEQQLRQLAANDP